MIRTAVLLVNWNGWEDTIECLESIKRLEPAPEKVIVCDNGSDDSSLTHIREWAQSETSPLLPGYLSDDDTSKELQAPIQFAEFTKEEAESGEVLDDGAWLILIRSENNLGFAGGNNIGLRYISTLDIDFIWLLNNDTVVHRDSLQALLRRVEGNPDIGICGSTLLHYDTPDKVQVCAGGYYCRWIGLPWHIGQLRSVDRLPAKSKVERCMNYVVGASMLVSRPFLDGVGLLTEDYFLYFEELDWAVRARGRYRLAYAPDSLVYHKVGASIGTSSDPRRKSMVCDYYAIRNRLLFTRRHEPIALPTVYLSVFCAFWVRLLLGEWQRAAMIWKILMGKQPDIIPGK